MYVLVRMDNSKDSKMPKQLLFGELSKTRPRHGIFALCVRVLCARVVCTCYMSEHSTNNEMVIANNYM